MSTKTSRRLSLASTASDIGSSFLSEEDLHVLSSDQLQTVYEDIKKNIAELEEEMDLYNRFLSSHMLSVTEASHTTRRSLAIESSQDSGTGSPELCSLDVKSFDSGHRKGSLSPKVRVTDKWKCWLWQLELEATKSIRKENKVNFMKEMKSLKIRDSVGKQNLQDYNKMLHQLEEYSRKYSAGSERKGKMNKEISIPPEELEKLFESWTVSNLQQIVDNSRKAAILKSQMKQQTKESLEWNKRNNSMTLQLITIEKENDELRDTLRCLNENINKLNTEFTSSQRKLKAREIELAELTKDVGEQKRNESHLRSRIHFATERNARLQKRIKELQDWKMDKKGSLDDIGEVPTVEEFFCRDGEIMKLKNVIERRARASIKPMA